MSRTKHRKKRRSGSDPAPVELNVMPFIDIFSLLCTFLLFSAVFVTIGILEVQVPFLSNAAPDKDESKRELTIKVDVDKESVELTTSYSKAPIDESTRKFPRTPSGLVELHQQLVRLRSEHRDTDSLKLFVDDAVTYDELVDVLDEVKLRKTGDPQFATDASDPDAAASLYPKVIMGSVLL